MKISLVFPPFYLNSMYNLPPLGLINLATRLGRKNHTVRIVDCVLGIRRQTLVMGADIYDNCAEMILEQDPDVVGFSAQCTTYPGVVQIARRLRARKKTLKIFVGGHNASFVDEVTLERFPWIDAVIRGEGEVTCESLITAYQDGNDGSGVDGVTFRRGDNIIRNRDRTLIEDLDQLDVADYTYVAPLSVYRDACDLPRSIAVLEVGRGCPHQCVYCSESILWQRRTRTYSVDRLIKEMRHLAERFGAECFLLAYDQFTANCKFVESFCRQVIANQLNHFPWYCISRLDTVDDGLLRLMREAGCESMCYGIDSGSQRTLQFINKRIDPSILYQRVQATTDVGIIPTLSYIIGFPEEEKDDIDSTLMLALKTGVQGNSNPLIQMPTVLPGTPLHKRYHDRLVREVDTYFSLGIEFDQGRRLALDDRLIDDDPSMFSSFYNLETKGMGLAHLSVISNCFPYVVNLYPKSFILLCTALQRSVSDLFLEWLTWIKTKEAYPGLWLNPRDCYRYFALYFKDLFDAQTNTEWKHLYEIIDYETMAIRVGEHDRGEMTVDGEARDLLEWRPALLPNVAVTQFQYNLPYIIHDIKAGVYSAAYTPETVSCVFRHAQNELEVIEINRFGDEFLNRCDGSLSLKEIAAALQPTHGPELPADSFFEHCREAMEGLIALHLLHDAPRLKTKKGGELNAEG